MTNNDGRAEQKNAKIFFVGAGPGAVDLITLRGRDLLASADVVIYAGSLVNPKLLEYTKDGCEVFDSAGMTLEEVTDTMIDAVKRGLLVVRLHTGDPSLYGAIREQMDILRAADVDFEVVPGVSSFSAAAAALDAEYTLPGVSQSLIITRAAGRTPVPDGESLRSYASHGASMALFLSSGMIDRVCGELIEGGYPPDTPAAVVYKASWPEQRVVRGALSTISDEAKREEIDKTALILVGKFLGDDYERSKLYDPTFSHGFREAKEKGEGIEGRKKIFSGSPGKNSIKNDAPAIAAFSAQGMRTARKISARIGGVVYAPPRFVAQGKESENFRAIDCSLGEWAKQHFPHDNAIIFVSAVGIAVRAIAPFVRDKTTDPAVVCLDDIGRSVVPILSGHLGGANDLAAKIAEITGGNAVLTTATDLHGITAADSWAARSGMAVQNPGAIRDVSGAMLDGKQIGVAITDEEIAPPWPVTLFLRPKNLVLGVGCRRDISTADLSAAIEDFLEGAGASPLSLAAVASIDIKKDEHAIVEWSANNKIPFHTYSADELNALAGNFSSSERVLETTGTDNVCERAATLAATELSPQNKSVLMRSKTKYGTITLALAKMAKIRRGAQ